MEKYRPDIDGLRAVAVISVVLFHAGVKALDGGYVGVDIFFVISGYLITRYICQKIFDGKFRIVEFYERRARRILPALLFFLILSSGFALWVLFPNDLYNFSKSEIAAVLFAPNIWLYHHSGYFDGRAKLKPLLHLWSLGVEEQFYIFFPPAMMIVARWGRRGMLAMIYVGSLTSFAVSVWTVSHDPNGAFYLVPFRAWELMLGSILALGPMPSIHSARVRNVLAAVGLVLIFASCFLYSPDTPFPGATALLPCIGSGLIIYSNECGLTVVGRLLAVRPMVAIGLISYSLYLWHWAMLVFAEQFFGHSLTVFETTGVVLFSVLAAALSWKFAEQPFRRRIFGRSRAVLFAEMAVLAACLTMAAGIVLLTHGVPQRFSAAVTRFAEGRSDRDGNLISCDASVARIEQGGLCRLGIARSGKADFVLWGDSHAAAIAPAFRTLAEENGVMGWLVDHLGCAPLLGVVRLDPGISGCAEFNEAVIDAIERHNVAVVVLAARWDINALGRTSWELAEGLHQVFLEDTESRTVSLTENQAVFARGLARTLTRLQQSRRTVLLLMDVPNIAMDTPMFLARSANRGLIGENARVDIAPYNGAEESVDEILLRLGQESGAVVVNLKSVLCNGSGCLIAKDGRSLFRDDHHLTLFGALQFVNPLRPDFQRSVLSISGS